MTCCQGSRRFYGLWLFILWEEQTAAATVYHTAFFVHKIPWDTVILSNLSDMFWLQKIP